jgi:hypothetical protein
MMLFGVNMKLIAGIKADLVHSRFNTPYFVSFMLTGIVLGKLAGLKSATRLKSQEAQSFYVRPLLIISVILILHRKYMI